MLLETEGAPLPGVAQHGITGTATASASYSASYGPERAFEDPEPNGNDWLLSDGQLPGWIQFDFGAGDERLIAEYAVSVGTNGNTVTAWTLKGSNDGATWTILDTQSGVDWSGYSVNGYKRFVIG